jgi:hypothetical protein
MGFEGRLSCGAALAAVLTGTLACAPTTKEVDSRGDVSRPPWPVLTHLPRLDPSKVVTVPGTNAQLFRTELVLAFDSGVTDQSKQALFTTYRLRVLGVTPSGTFFVRFADRGPSFRALELFMDTLRTQADVETVAPINATPLREEG